MYIAVRSCALAAALFVLFASEYFVGVAYGRDVVFTAYPQTLSPPTFLETPVPPAILAGLALGFVFAVLLGDPRPIRFRLFDADRLSRMRVGMTFGLMLTLILFFAYAGFADLIAYAVIVLDGLLVIGVISRVAHWAGTPVLAAADR